MAPRTKSCAVCRKKRIRCDATLPECLMCLRTGRLCPGIPDGPLIVDMTKTARLGMLKRKPKMSAIDNLPVMEALIHPDDRGIYFVSDRAIVTEAFYARFMSFFTSEGEGRDIQNRLTWLHRLPMFSTDGTNGALELAVQATASAFCAVESGDLSLTRHAWELYGRALRTHGRFLARSRSKHEVTVHMVSTSVLFSFFEAMQAANASAYRSHIYGAAKMLEVTGPGQCAQGILCQIFFHLRTQMAFVHLTGNGADTPVEVRKILLGTLEYTKLPIFQRLMSHVSALAEMYIARRDSWTQQPIDITVAHMLEAEIGTLWEEYTRAATDVNEKLSWLHTTKNTTRFRDEFTALTIAYFCSAYILLHIVAPQLTVTSTESVDYHATILQASAYLRTYKIGCAYMRMATPLLLVALHAPRLDQRTAATSCFEHWLGKSMRGISTLALWSIHRHRAQSEQVTACYQSLSVHTTDIRLP